MMSTPTFSYKKEIILEVAEHDFPEKMNWEDAKKACEELGEGWRLPTKEELFDMFNMYYLKGIGNFKKDGAYWLLEHNTLGMFQDDVFNFYAGYEFQTKFETYSVRAVRTVNVAITPGR